MLALVEKQVLAKVLFPLGELTREEVISYAHSHGIKHVQEAAKTYASCLTEAWNNS